jgi:hypothetical protein
MIILYDIGEKSKFPQDVYENISDADGNVVVDIANRVLISKKDLYVYDLGIKDNLLIAETDANEALLAKYNINYTIINDITQYENFTQLVVNNAFGEKLTQKVLEAYLMLRTLPVGHYTVADFLGKFTLTQLSNFATSIDPDVKGLYIWVSNLRENDINTTDPRIIGGMQVLIAKGIIDQASYNTIMA